MLKSLFLALVFQNGSSYVWVFIIAPTTPPPPPLPAVDHFAHTRYYTEAEAILPEWLNRLMKLSIHFPSLSFPLAWKSKDFYTASSQFFEFHELSSGGRNWAEHLEIIGSLWLFIRRKMLKTRSVPIKMFWDSQRFHCSDLLPGLLGEFVIDLCFLISERTKNFSSENLTVITYRNRRYF